MTASWLDRDPPADASLAAAYWCDMDYFLVHTATGEHPECRCREGQGHRNPEIQAKFELGRRRKAARR